MIDLAHLGRQCFGEKDLERELLLEFRSQALRLAHDLAEDVGLAPGAKADLAHRLRGSALAVGAAWVARAAAVVETSARAAAGPGVPPSSAGDLSRAISALSEAATEAAAEIERLLGAR